MKLFVGAGLQDTICLDSGEEQSNRRMLIGPETTKIFNSIAADGRGV